MKAKEQPMITYVPIEEFNSQQQHLTDLQEIVDETSDRLHELEEKMDRIKSAADKFIRGGLAEEELVFVLLQATSSKRTKVRA